MTCWRTKRDSNSRYSSESMPLKSRPNLRSCPAKWPVEKNPQPIRCKNFGLHPLSPVRFFKWPLDPRVLDEFRRSGWKSASSKFSISSVSEWFFQRMPSSAIVSSATLTICLLSSVNRLSLPQLVENKRFNKNGFCRQINCGEARSVDELSQELKI